MIQIKPIRNHIIFQFEEEKATYNGTNQFKERTDWGFEFVHLTTSMEFARWVTVIAVGPEVPEYITPKMRVCVDKLKWTKGILIDGEMYWRTDSDQILLIEEN